MGKLRVSIAGLMGLVLVAAVGLAALKNASETWAGGMLMLTCGILALAVVGALFGAGRRRAWWLGFCLFGCSYMAISRCWSAWNLPRLPTTIVLEFIGPRLGFPLQPTWGGDLRVEQWYGQTGHCLWTLLAAWLGGMLAGFFFASPRDHSEVNPSEARETSQYPRNRWLLPAITGFVVLILLSTLGTIWSRTFSPLWAGVAFTLTGALIGLAALGAVCGRGKRRAIWLGATFFGAGYMALIFSRPVGQPTWAYSPTDQFLIGLRPWFPRVLRGIDPANTHILEVLDQPVPMRFPNETPLSDVLKHITTATSTQTDPGIPIYVDPIGLQEAERSLNSTVQIDLEGVPLKTSLRLCLKQLGLDYDVQDTYLRIIAEGQVSLDLKDPFLIAGHCLIALLAAGFGAVAAPLVADARREPSRRAAVADAPSPFISPEDQAGRSAGVKSEEND